MYVKSIIIVIMFSKLLSAQFTTPINELPYIAAYSHFMIDSMDS